MLPAKKHCHPHSASAPGHCGSSIAQFLNQIIPSADFPHSKMSNSCLTQPNTYIEPLHNTSRMLHSTFGSSAAFCFLLHFYAAAPHPVFQAQHPSSHGDPQKEGCWNQYPVVILITAYSHRQSRYQLLLSTTPQALLSVRTQLAVLSEVLNGTDHLRGVGVLVVVPGHDPNLIGIVVATLNFSHFFVIVHNFETTVTVPQHTVVVPKPACSYQNYTTFRRYFQVFSHFCVLDFFAFPHFLCVWIFMWYRACSSERPGPKAAAEGVRPAQMRSSGWCDEGLDDGLMGVLMDWLWRWVYFWFLKEYFWSDWSCFWCADCLWYLLICTARLLCLCSPLLFFCWNFTGCNFEG